MRPRLAVGRCTGCPERMHKEKAINIAQEEEDEEDEAAAAAAAAAKRRREAGRKA